MSGLRRAEERKGEEDALTSHPGGLAQLARAPALQAGGHRFDSDILHKEQLVVPLHRPDERTEFVQRHRPGRGSLVIRKRSKKTKRVL